MGLKHSATDQMPFARLHAWDWPVYGEQSDDASGLTIGAVGCVDGPLNVAPELWMAIWDAYTGGRLREAEAAQETAWEFVDRMLACGGTYHALAKAALGMRLGIECGDTRAPAAPLTPEQRSARATDSQRSTVGAKRRTVTR